MDQITYPSGRMVAQGYDSMGRLNQIASAGSVYLSGLNYNAAGQLLGASYGSGVVGTFGYNDHLQISSLKYDKGSSNLLNLSYGYGGSNNGQIQSVTDGRGAAYSASYSYDELGRLSLAQTNDLTAPNTWKLAFGYDRYGNRLTQTLIQGTASITQPQLTVDASTNRISSTGFVYDAAGNLTNDSLHTYSFNVESEITAVDGGTTASYAYDGNRWRVQKTVAGASTTYVYSGSKVIAEYVGGVLRKEYIYSGGNLLATVAGNVVSYEHPDQLSTRLETDSTGAITRSFGHYPFGESWYETGAASKWKFTSYERDSESNLDYALNRFDSSRLGRFMSPDLLAGSLAAPQSLNHYSYVLNDPIGLVDPLGTGPCDPEDYSPEDCAALTAFQNHGLGAGAGGAGDSNNSYLIFRPGRQDNGGDGNSYAANFVKALVKDFSQAQIDAWNKGYYKCLAQKNLPGFSATATAHVATDVASETASHFAPELAGAYYHLTDARFSSWGKYSKVLVPEAATSIKLWTGRLNAAAWVYADYELAKSIGECSEVLH